jgi:glycosyltransferase involved in cell wall biosynthesis
MGNKILALGQVYDDRVFYKMNAPKIPGKRSFVYVGRMAEEKNVLDLVRVAKRLEKEGEDFILHMIGGGTPEPYADLVTKEIGASRNIVFKNTWLPHENLRSVYNMFDYLVIPSKFESFCCSALEGLACGCGLITNTKTMEWANGKRINGTDLSEDFEEGLYLAMKKAIREPVAESFSKDVFEKFSYTKNRSRWREVLE